MPKKIFLLITLLSSGFLRRAGAQTMQPDTAFYTRQINNAIAAYNRFTDGNAPLYNGGAYLKYNLPAKGNALFRSEGWQQGTVSYDGVLYDAMLFYDIVKDQLVVLGPDKVSPIVLHSERVDYFTLPDHTFIYIRKDSTAAGAVPAGFCDRLYTGGIMVLAKRSKYLHESVSQDGIKREFLEKDRFYIRKEDVYYPVKRKRDVLQVFGDQKKALRKYLHKNKIWFHKDPEHAIIRMSAYYDQLKH